jgi:hypothetical protein
LFADPLPTPTGDRNPPVHATRLVVD